ncbi:MAG TPA: 23S rRNA (guanosine(2251)-2'-O)-methyltransferase RlmB [Acidimicrobiales bacterium]|nr:23S rRNA (guanosine(2251)-2'-O)-methyltransferase RlmB [Acidimicrobiales bacterium]
MPRRRAPRAVEGERKTDRIGLGGEHVEGRRAVRELLAAGRRPVREVILAGGQDSSSLLDEIVQLAGERDVPLRIVSQDELRTFAQSSSPQGVVALASAIRAVGLDELVRASDGSRPASTPKGDVPFLFVLAEVTDPHNVGAICRSALGAGATGIVIGKHRGAHFSPSALKAAAGAIEHLPIALVPGVAQALGELVRRGVWTVGLDPEGEATLDTLPVATEPIALVVGAEGEGLSPLVKQRCDLRCRIPLYGPVGSLNVSVAAAIAGFSIAAKRAASEKSNSEVG